MIFQFYYYYNNHDNHLYYINCSRIIVVADVFWIKYLFISDRIFYVTGTGLALLHSDFYYLNGILSSENPLKSYSIGVFTDVKYHIQWIRELYNKYT